MQRRIETLTSNGIDYRIEYECDGSDLYVMWVDDSAGNRVADAEWDSASESVFFAYFDDDGRMPDFDGASSDLYNKPWHEVAEWLIQTHPCN